MKGRGICFHAAVVWLVTALVAAACGSDVAYSRYESTPIDGWRRGDTLSFVVPPVPQLGENEASLGVRVSYLYPYGNLALAVEQQSFADGTTFRLDTIECFFSDSADVSHGKGISLYHHDESLRMAAELRSDTVKIRVWHVMSRTSLPGISDVGITIRRRAER